MNETLFVSLAHARAALATWKDDYNTIRPHSRLGNLPPAAYAKLSDPAMQWDGALRSLILEALLADSLRDSRIAAMLIEGGVEGLRHAISGEIATGLFGGGASGARPSVEGRQPEPAAFVAGCGPGWNGPGRAAAKVGGMDRQTLRDWVHRFNAWGPEGLIDNWTEGPKPRLSKAQLAEVAQLVEAGPDREKDGVVRWRRIDLKRVIAERFGVDFHERYVGKLLKTLGFSHISARPRHPAQDERIVEAFKNVWPARSQRGCG